MFESMRVPCLHQQPPRSRVTTPQQNHNTHVNTSSCSLHRPPSACRYSTSSASGYLLLASGYPPRTLLPSASAWQHCRWRGSRGQHHHPTLWWCCPSARHHSSVCAPLASAAWPMQRCSHRWELHPQHADLEQQAVLLMQLRLQNM